MTSFEFVFGLISIITSLAVTHLISGLIAYVRHRARFSLRHALWSWTAFALVVANWASFWDDRAVDWEPRAVLLWLALMISLYAFSALTVPEIERGDKVDLVAFHESDGKRYIAAHILFAVIVIAGFATSTLTFADGSAPQVLRLSAWRLLSPRFTCGRCGCSKQSPLPWPRSARSSCSCA